MEQSSKFHKTVSKRSKAKQMARCILMPKETFEKLKLSHDYPVT